MKKPPKDAVEATGLGDKLRPEYDAATLRGLLMSGVRGKYAERSRQATNVVRLAPDVAAAFPTEEAVNAALRGLVASGSVPELGEGGDHLL